MAQLDQIIKQLVAGHVADFAVWILNWKVEHVSTRTVEPITRTQPLRTGQVFYVRPIEGPGLIFHIEFQGRGTKHPIPMRMLHYIAHLTDQYPDVCIAT